MMHAELVGNEDFCMYPQKLGIAVADENESPKNTAGAKLIQQYGKGRRMG